MMQRLRRFLVSSLALAAAIVAFSPAPTRAMNATSQVDPGSLLTAANGFSFSLGTSVGLVEGTARELVFYYPPPYGKKFKLSELTWDLKDVVMAGVHGSVEYGRWFRLNLGVWSALTAGNGMMVDRDWNYSDHQSAVLQPSDSNWTDESRHPDTSLDKGTIVDLSLNILPLPAGPFSLRAIVGYKSDTWSWSARGGTYVYSTHYYGSRDFTGAFPAGLEVITYEQRYSIPYVGVGASWTWPAFQVDSRLLYSSLVSAGDRDDHLLRGVLFEGDFSRGTYVGLGVNATWAFARRWAATLGVEYQSISEIVGDFTQTGAEGYGYYRDAGGIAMSAMSAVLGARYRF